VGAVTDYSAYYPPRMSMKVNWYAANPAFHPILPGYGLPWGTKDEKKIPRWVHHEAQRALAAEQLKTQTPELVARSIPEPGMQHPSMQHPSMQPQPLRGPFPPPPRPQPPEPLPLPLMPEDRQAELPAPPSIRQVVGSSVAAQAAPVPDEPAATMSPLGAATQELPDDWPDPRGFIPDPPRPHRGLPHPQTAPIISHMRSYNGHDDEFTQRLSEYFYFRDDARFGGWQAYLQRSEDFIRVCCHFHVTETLVSRGGADESRLIFRWPLDRYLR
jgi:hypothetical protein